MNCLRTTLSVGMAILAGATLVQGEDLVTDRPDQTESSVTVGPGKIQVEMGYTHAEDDEGDKVKTDSLPESLVRFGIVEDFELRLIWGGYQWQETTTGGTTTRMDGANDMAAGLKIRFWEEQGWIPETALLTHLSLPVGKTGFSSERVDPDLRFAFSHTLNDTFSLGYNLGTAWTTTENSAGDLSQRNLFIYTAALGIGLTEALGAFVEFFGDIPTYSHSPGPENSFDGGFTYQLTDNLQLDASGGIGLSKAADDWFLGIGLSFRLPN